MDILLTGADGFTGKHFAKQATIMGHRIVPLKCDLTDSESLKLEIEQDKFDAVVHLAAISYVDHADDRAFYDVNVIGTTTLLAALCSLQLKPKVVLLASSANIYGNCTASPISENQAAFPVNHYAMSKLAMEYMAHTFLENLPIVFARPFNYTGPGQSLNFLIPKLVDHFIRRAPLVRLGNVQVEREFNDVRMVCDAYLTLLEHGQIGQTYNICTGKAYTLEKVIDVLSELSDHKLRVEVSPDLLRANEVHRLCGDLSKLQRVLSLTQRELFNPSLRQTLEWMLAEHTL